MIGIFKAVKILKQIKNHTFDPKKLAKEEGMDLTSNILAVPIIVFSGAAVFCLIFGFTDLWFGPSLFLGILGIALLLPTIILWIIKNKITKIVEKYFENKA